MARSWYLHGENGLAIFWKAGSGNKHELLAVGHPKNLVQVGRGAIAAIGWVVEILVKGTSIEDCYISVTPAGKPEGGTQTENASTDDDDLGVGCHHVGLDGNARKRFDMLGYRPRSGVNKRMKNY